MPYLFLKPSRGAVVGSGDEIVIPYGRDRTDWEVELGAVIGRTARYVSAAEAQDHVFGYMVSIDVSDRGGRPPGGNPIRSDWFVGKGHDTFAPQGPWIVPREFYGDPMENLRQTLSVDGTLLQEARAGDMIHSLWELIEYGSSIITLYPGDVINNGTSGGTAAGAPRPAGRRIASSSRARWSRRRSTASARCGSRSSPARSRPARRGPGCRRSSRIAECARRHPPAVDIATGLTPPDGVGARLDWLAPPRLGQSAIRNRTSRYAPVYPLAGSAVHIAVSEARLRAQMFAL